MSNTEKRIVHADGREIVYLLERKDVRNLNLRVHKDGSVYVSAHVSVPVKEIDAFVLGKSAYVLSAIDRFHEMDHYKPQPKRYVSGETFVFLGRSQRLVVEQAAREGVSSDGVYITLQIKDPADFDKKKRLMSCYLSRQCRTVFLEMIDTLYPVFEKYGVAKPKLCVRDMETRWGSCSVRKGVITLNKRLLEVSRDCIEYVVMHEYCHFLYPNHSKQFYSVLTMLMPDWRLRKETLDKHAEYWL